MIAFVQGTLEEIEESGAIVQSGGVGFRVFTPIREELFRIGIGAQVKFFTYLSVREDAMLLFGFLDRASLELFKLLISVSGVGPKMALGVLTAMSADEVAMAIASDDKKALSAVSGIGKKTAERIILELKEKLTGIRGDSLPAAAASQTAPAASSALKDALLALVTLGYSQSEAQKALKDAGVTPEMDTESMIKLALKQLF